MKDSFNKYIDLSLHFKRFIVIDKSKTNNAFIIVKMDQFYYFDLTDLNIYCTQSLVKLKSLNEDNLIQHLTCETELFTYYKSLLLFKKVDDCAH